MVGGHNNAVARSFGWTGADGELPRIGCRSIYQLAGGPSVHRWYRRAKAERNAIVWQTIRISRIKTGIRINRTTRIRTRTRISRTIRIRTIRTRTSRTISRIRTQDNRLAGQVNKKRPEAVPRVVYQLYYGIKELKGQENPYGRRYGRRLPARRAVCR